MRHLFVPYGLFEWVAEPGFSAVYTHLFVSTNDHAMLAADVFRDLAIVVEKPSETVPDRAAASVITEIDRVPISIARIEVFYSCEAKCQSVTYECR